MQVSRARSLVVATTDPKTTGSEFVCWIELNRPEARNALNLDLRRAIRKAVLDAQSSGARVIVISGRGGTFSAGADVALLAKASPADVRRMALWDYWAPIVESQLPVVFAVEGFALGGSLELALSGDRVIAAEDARLGFPEVKLGIMPGSGGTQRLLRLVGRQKALRLLLSGEIISGGEADRIGLIAAAVPSGEAVKTALLLAGGLASGAGCAIKSIRDVIRSGTEMSFEEAILHERKAFAALFDTRDQQEGMAAFLEKRRPTFQGT